MDALDRSAATGLTRLYALALGLVAALSVAAQVAVQIGLHRARNDAEVVYLAGRQRMLSQRLTLTALTAGGDPAMRDRVASLLAEWTVAHARLRDGDGRSNSPAVEAAFRQIDEPFTIMVRAARLPIDAAALLAAQDRFLAGMERIVALYRDEAEARVDRLISLELGLCLLLLVVLALEALLVFRPAVRRLRQAISDRERLRAQEAANRELQVAADTARGIGQDLHDGLGQTLTALSFQAKAVGDTALVDGITEAIAQCRAQARRLAPVDIQAAGLEAALRELADSTTRAAGVVCVLEWTAPGPPASTGADLFRICQEAITNALRHGRARRIVVAIGPRTLLVVDDGQGGSPGVEGVGLSSMRSRAERLGATLSAGSRPGGGWEVRLALP